MTAPALLAPPANPPGPGKVGVFLVAFLGLSLGMAGCATFNGFVQACKDCVSKDGPQDVRDLESEAGHFIEHVLMCDPTFDASALAPCVGQGLAGVVAAMGPDGLRFRDCVLAEIENDPAAQPLAKKAARTSCG